MHKFEMDIEKRGGRFIFFVVLNNRIPVSFHLGLSVKELSDEQMTIIRMKIVLMLRTYPEYPGVTTKIDENEPGMLGEFFDEAMS